LCAAARLGKIGERFDSVVQSPPQYQLDCDVVASDFVGSTDQRFQRGLQFEREVRSLLDGREHFLAVFYFDRTIAFSDPELVFRFHVVGGRSPHERNVLVEDARIDVGLSGFRLLHDVCDEEANARVLTNVGQVESCIKKVDAVFGDVSFFEKDCRFSFRGSRGTQPGAVGEEAAKLCRHASRRDVRGIGARGDLRRYGHRVAAAGLAFCIAEPRSSRKRSRCGIVGSRTVRARIDRGSLLGGSSGSLTAREEAGRRWKRTTSRKRREP
jgi:hypothetical protein